MRYLLLIVSRETSAQVQLFIVANLNICGSLSVSFRAVDPSISVHVHHASFSVDGLIETIYLGNCRTLVI